MRRALLAFPAAALLLAGCGGSSPKAAPDPTPSPTPTTATPSPTLTPKQQGAKDAMSVVRQFVQLSGKISDNPAMGTQSVQSLLSNDVYAQYAKGIKQQQSAKTHDRGALKVVWMRAKPVTVKNKSAGTVVSYCYDLSGVKFVDSTGTAHAIPKSQARGIEYDALANGSWPNAAGWRIINRTLKGGSCG